MILTIVGAGATALAFLHNFLADIAVGAEASITVYLVEKRGLFGAGAAYAPDVPTNLLNTKTGFITPFHDRPGDFYRWLSANEAQWRPAYPDFLLDTHSYAPRPLFGMYMRKQMARLIKQALEKNVRIIQVDAEVKDIVQLGGSYVTKTDCSMNLTSDYVFLCCGTLPARNAWAANPAILASPYPVEQLRRRVAGNARVAIAGARLSCIDAVIGLVEGGHTGPIVIHSRSGHFPSVRGTQGRIVPKLLTAPYLYELKQLKGTLSLAEMADLVSREIALQAGAATAQAFVPPAPPAELESFLRREIALAQAPRLWQAVLYATNVIIDQLWNLLSDADKRVFLKDYFSLFMSYRVSIPEENARKLLRYLESGQLRFQAGAFSIDAAGPLPTLTMADASVHEYDVVINAVGSPRALRELDSELIGNLLRRGTLVEHPLGGIAIDPVNYQVMGAAGRAAGMYALGELTTGTFFFTSALDINARHARSCAMGFGAALRQNAVEPLELCVN